MIKFIHRLIMLRRTLLILVIVGTVRLSHRSNASRRKISMIEQFRRIIDGYKVDIYSIPYYVYFVMENEKREYNCGGTLISHRWVLTAAHCLYKNGKRVPNDEMILYAGTISSEYFDHRVQIKHVVTSEVHPGWKNLFANKITNHDIALLKTCSPLEYSDYVKPIALAPSNYQIPDGVVALACGFGDTKTNGPPTKSKDLYAVALLKRKCLGTRHPDTIICFEGKNTPEAGICHGDSGGPLIFLEASVPILIGVASGTGCKIKKGGGSFTEVSLYRDWIRATTGV